MTLRDSVGHPVTGATPDALSAFEQAARQLRCYIGDPVASVERAVDLAPDMTMTHVLRAWLHLLGTEPAGLAVARGCLAAAASLPANERERGHLAAIRHLVDGRWRDAGCVLEDLSVAYPHDSLALQAGHQIDFFTGDARMLRDRIARVLPSWSRDMPGYHALLGMYAFGLEETGDYARAESFGRASVELERRDGWGWHAVAHVMEMQNRIGDGITWMQSDPEAWSKDSFLAVHNAWHLALFYLERGDGDAALAAFDGPIHGARSTAVMDMVDASAMLWRLQLRGVDVGTRWESVADGWATVAGAGNYAFNDLHAMLAFIGADRGKARQAVIDSLEAQSANGAGDIGKFAREVGLPAARGMLAFGQGCFAEAVNLLRGIRSIAYRFGGSHAQRDLLDLTLIEAAIRSDQTALAAALIAERSARRPHSALTRWFERRVRPLDQVAQAA